MSGHIINPFSSEFNPTSSFNLSSHESIPALAYGLIGLTSLTLAYLSFVDLKKPNNTETLKKTDNTETLKKPNNTETLPPLNQENNNPEQIKTGGKSKSKRHKSNLKTKSKKNHNK
jgi:hypothetical protein